MISNNSLLFFRLLESQSLEEGLKKYIHPSESDPVIRQKLKAYISTKPEELSVVMRYDYSPANETRFVQPLVYSLQD